MHGGDKIVIENKIFRNHGTFSQRGGRRDHLGLHEIGLLIKKEDSTGAII